MKAIARSFAIEMALQQRAMGRRIAQLRERAHLTQEAAADKAGVTLRAYQKWEAGGGIQYANLQKLAEVLQVPVDQITGEPSTPDLSLPNGPVNEEVRARLANIEATLAELLRNVRGEAPEAEPEAGAGSRSGAG